MVACGFADAFNPYCGAAYCEIGKRDDEGPSEFEREFPRELVIAENLLLP
jgi:hypothetical protein